MWYKRDSRWTRGRVRCGCVLTAHWSRRWESNSEASGYRTIGTSREIQNKSLSHDMSPCERMNVGWVCLWIFSAFIECHWVYRPHLSVLHLLLLSSSVPLCLFGTFFLFRPFERVLKLLSGRLATLLQWFLVRGSLWQRNYSSGQKLCKTTFVAGAQQLERLAVDSVGLFPLEMWNASVTSSVGVQVTIRVWVCVCTDILQEVMGLPLMCTMGHIWWYFSVTPHFDPLMLLHDTLVQTQAFQHKRS